MDPKPRPDDAMYIEILRRMTPEQKLMKVFELSSMSKAIFKEGLSVRFSDLSEPEFHKLFLERLALAHNRRD